MRRYTRKTNAYRKKLENHKTTCTSAASTSSTSTSCRIHSTLEVTPAVEAGIARAQYDLDWITAMVDEQRPEPNRPKKYRTKNSD